MLIVVDDRCMYVDRMPVWIVESKVVLMYICMLNVVGSRLDRIR